MPKDFVDDYDSDVDDWDDYDWCYECGGYGDDYYFTDDGELVCACGTPMCPNCLDIEMWDN